MSKHTIKVNTDQTASIESAWAEKEWAESSYLTQKPIRVTGRNQLCIQFKKLPNNQTRYLEGNWDLRTEVGESLGSDGNAFLSLAASPASHYRLFVWQHSTIGGFKQDFIIDSLDMWRMN